MLIHLKIIKLLDGKHIYLDVHPDDKIADVLVMILKKTGKNGNFKLLWNGKILNENYALKDHSFGKGATFTLIDFGDCSVDNGNNDNIIVG